MRVLSYARQCLGVTHFRVLLGIDLVNGIERLSAQVAADAFRVGYVQHRIALRTALHTLIYCWQKTTAENTFARIRSLATRQQNHETRQVIVLRS
jgi:hypothetical protein